MVTGLNTEAQVNDAVDALDGIKPRPDLFQKAYDLWKADFKTA